MSSQQNSNSDLPADTPVADLPKGMRRRLASGEEVIDAVCGRTSVFGFAFAPMQEALRSLLPCDLGDSAEMIDDEPLEGGPSGDPDVSTWSTSRAEGSETLAKRLREMLAGSEEVATDNLLLRPSADAAVDTALGLARRYRPGRSFRTIALLGSDHGRTGMCRSASGRPELHEGFGPMMAGFTHVPVGDVDALRAAVDEQTACVLISPVDLRRAAIACDSDYLSAVREVCDQHDLLLVIDETKLVFGASGKPLTLQAIGNVRADIAIVSAGLFAGLPGGLILGSAKILPTQVTDLHRFPWQAAVASETVELMQRHDLPKAFDGGTHPLAVAIAKVLDGFEFVRDIHAMGLTIGIETDLDSKEILRVARRAGLHLAQAGPSSVCLQPPLVISDEDQQLILARLSSTMESLERASAELSL